MHFHELLIENKKYQDEIDKLAKIVISQIGTNKSVLITGGTGTIGSEQVDAIMWANQKYNANIHLFIQTRNLQKAYEMFPKYINSPLFSVDERNIEQGIDTNINYDAIFHYACNADPKTYENDKTGTRNGILEGTKKVMQYAIHHPDCKVLYASTMEVYGQKEGNLGLNIKETDELGTNLSAQNWRDYVYSLAKIEAEKLCLQAVNMGANVTIGRFPYMYGPTHQEGNSLAINQWLDSARKNDLIEIKSPTAGGIFRKYENVADGLRYAMYQLNAPSGDIANLVGTENIRSFLDMAKIIAEQANVKFISAPQDDYTTKKLVSNCLNGEKIQKTIEKLDKENTTSRIYNSTKESIKMTIEIMQETDMECKKNIIKNNTNQDIDKNNMIQFEI